MTKFNSQLQHSSGEGRHSSGSLRGSVPANMTLKVTACKVLPKFPPIKNQTNQIINKKKDNLVKSGKIIKNCEQHSTSICSIDTKFQILEVVEEEEAR